MSLNFGRGLCNLADADFCLKSLVLNRLWLKKNTYQQTNACCLVKAINAVTIEAVKWYHGELLLSPCSAFLLSLGNSIINNNSWDDVCNFTSSAWPTWKANPVGRRPNQNQLQPKSLWTMIKFLVLWEKVNRPYIPRNGPSKLPNSFNLNITSSKPSEKWEINTHLSCIVYDLLDNCSAVWYVN